MEASHSSFGKQDIFSSVYTHDYVYFEDCKRPAQPHFTDEFAICEGHAKRFAKGSKKKKQKEEEEIANLTLEDFEKEKAKLIKERMKSVYTVDYTGVQGYEWRTDLKEMLDPANDELIVNAEKIYVLHKKMKPRLPLPSSRRGYCSLKDYLTEHSTYAETIGKVGYDVIKKQADLGGARLGPRYNYEKAFAVVDNVLRRKSMMGADGVPNTDPIDYKSLLFESPFKKKPEEKKDLSRSPSSETSVIKKPGEKP